MKKIWKSLLCLGLSGAMCAMFTACDLELGGGIWDSIHGGLDYENSLGGSDDSGNKNSGKDSSSDSASIGDNENTASFSINIPFLGNATSGDCTLIKVGENTEILIDAGSTTGSAATIVPYISQYCTDGVLEYVIATHGDSDHISSFVGGSNVGVFESFVCGTIIDFPKTTKNTQIYQNYMSLRDAEVAAGAKHYTALQCWNNADGAQRKYTLGTNVTMEILYHKYYETTTSTENNYSVCVLFTQGENHYLFTGDLEESGEKSLVENNVLPKCTFYKAGHHGSNTASTTALMSVIQPEIVAANCCCGDKYDFPHQEFINNIAPYTDKLYIPAMVDSSSSKGYTLLNGNITLSSLDGITETVNCSNNNTLFKDTEWFKKNRTTPTAWQ